MPTSWSVALALLSMLLITVLVLAAWFDVRERRIPNWITAGGLVGALLLRAVLGPDVVWTAFLGGAVGMTVGVPLYATGAMGAGDAKLLMAVGCLVGLDAFLWCLLLTGVFGGVLALAQTIWNGTLLPTLLRTHGFLVYLMTFGRAGTLKAASTPDTVTVPYGLAIAMGAYTALLGWGLTL